MFSLDQGSASSATWRMWGSSKSYSSENFSSYKIKILNFSNMKINGSIWEFSIRFIAAWPLCDWWHKTGNGAFRFGYNNIKSWPRFPHKAVLSGTIPRWLEPYWKLGPNITPNAHRILGGFFSKLLLLVTLLGGNNVEKFNFFSTRDRDSCFFCLWFSLRPALRESLVADTYG